MTSVRATDETEKQLLVQDLITENILLQTTATLVALSTTFQVKVCRVKFRLVVIPMQCDKFS